MDIGTGDFRVQWVREHDARIFLTNLDVFSLCGKRLSHHPPKWFGLLSNSNGMLESACTSPQELIVTYFQNLLSVTSHCQLEICHGGCTGITEIDKCRKSGFSNTHACWWTSTSTHRKLASPLISPQPHLRGCVAYREDPLLWFSCVFLLCISRLTLVLSSTILRSAWERAVWGGLCGRRLPRWWFFFPLANKLYGRSFYLSCPQLPLHYNKSNLDH